MPSGFALEKHAFEIFSRRLTAEEQIPRRSASRNDNLLTYDSEANKYPCGAGLLLFRHINPTSGPVTLQDSIQNDQLPPPIGELRVLGRPRGQD